MGSSGKLFALNNSVLEEHYIGKVFHFLFLIHWSINLCDHYQKSAYLQ